MEGVTHDYILMGLDLKTDEEYAGWGNGEVSGGPRVSFNNDKAEEESPGDPRMPWQSLRRFCLLCQGCFHWYLTSRVQEDTQLLLEVTNPCYSTRMTKAEVFRIDQWLRRRAGASSRRFGMSVAGLGYDTRGFERARWTGEDPAARAFGAFYVQG